MDTSAQRQDERAAGPVAAWLLVTALDDLICLAAVSYGVFLCLTRHWESGPPILGAYLAGRLAMACLRAFRTHAAELEGGENA